MDTYQHQITYRILYYDDRYTATIYVDSFRLMHERFYYYHDAASWIRIQLGILHRALA